MNGVQKHWIGNREVFVSVYYRRDINNFLLWPNVKIFYRIIYRGFFQVVSLPFS
jgi:hypothetical protein